MKLHELAHSRTGDKGDISVISVIAWREADFPFLVEHVTEAAVKAHFGDQVQGEVKRYLLPNLHAMNFVMQHALRGGVTRSLALDMHGKTLGYALLELELPEAPNV